MELKTTTGRDYLYLPHKCNALKATIPLQRSAHLLLTYGLSLQKRAD